MKPVITLFKSALLALTTLFTAPPPVVAKDNGEWKVNGDLIGKKDKVAEDLSGIACTTDSGFPRTCLLIDDEQQSAQVVTLSEGEITAGRLIPLIDDRFDGNPVELDGEGVAFADNFFYVIGSHGRPRHDKDATDQAKEAARVAAGLAASSKLIRLKFNPATGEIAREPSVPPSSALAKLIAAEALFAPSEGKTLEDGGVTVEGVAVGGQRLFAGFRGPVIENKRAVILSAALGHFFDGKPAEATLHLLPLGPGRGVRDLAAFDKGILILAGPMQDVGGTYSVYRWDGASSSAKLLVDLPDFISEKGRQWKPEALLPLDRDTSGVRVLVLLDSAKEGKPRAVRVPYP
ncbi:MAG: DUF3616 domain-containing protein [Pseudolabrys sp.]